MTARPVVAAFDFDGTITDRDSFQLYLRDLLGDAGFLAAVALSAVPIVACGLGLMDRGRAKEHLVRHALAGRTLAELAPGLAAFAADVLPRIVRPEALARIAWHRARGHRLLLVSASPELYLIPWATAQGFEAVLATRLEIGGDGRLTGRLAGRNCRAAEKVRRLTAYLGPLSCYELYAYGDSRGDREMLAVAEHGYLRKMPAPG